MREEGPLLVRFEGSFASGHLLRVAFVGCGADIAQGGVQANLVIEHFDVLEDALPRFASRLIISLVDKFFFQTGKEAFHDGVVITVPLAAHAACDVLLS